jgi:transposase InsO family protein
MKLAAYERELIGLVQAVRHWRPYLWGRHFTVRTDHYALKFLLDQRLSTVPQHQWVSKLFGFDFSVEFRPGRLNTVADALSRRGDELTPQDGTDAVLATLSGPSFQLYGVLRRELQDDPELRAFRDTVVADRGEPWRVVDGLVLKGAQVFVHATSQMVAPVIELAHTAGHEGIQKTLQRLRQHFHIDHDRRLVEDFVRACAVCQRNKTESLHPAGLLQPLEVPSSVWSDIAMDFVEGLPRVHGKSVILTVVDRFSKHAHFIALSHPYTATTVAKAFFKAIVRLHGFPRSIVSDRDPVFTGHVWKDLFKRAGVQLRMSTAFHPQTDGQSEIVNKTIAMYLRCITGDRPRAWLDWLPWAEYCYNMSYHSALKTTPFQVVFGRPPPALLPYTKGEASTDTVDTLLRDRDSFLQDVRERLLQAQAYAKRHYDGHHRALEFSVGDWVLLRLLHRPAQSLVSGKRSKLSPRFAGPYQVLERIGAVAYRLQLPDGARIHDVFHVGVLKPWRGAPPASLPALPPLRHGRILLTPEQAIKAQLRRGSWWILIKWTGLDATEATWELVDDFKTRFPEFQLEDELFVGEGRDVMLGKVYQRKERPAGQSG